MDNFAQLGDYIEIKLIDDSHRQYFKGKANLNSKKQLILLFKGIRAQGVDIPKESMDWFD